MIKALSCKCGDCLHWEIYQKPAAPRPAETEVVGRVFEAIADVVEHALGLDTETFMVCKTCGDEHHIKISFPDHEKLDWVSKDAA